MHCGKEQILRPQVVQKLRGQQNTDSICPELSKTTKYTIVSNRIRMLYVLLYRYWFCSFFVDLNTFLLSIHRADHHKLTLVYITQKGDSEIVTILTTTLYFGFING